jgi:hypothetical protein
VPSGTLSYFVLGWYSQATADVLDDWKAGEKGREFADLLVRLGWTASNPQTETTRSSLYQGAAFAVPWTPGGSAYPSPKDNVTPHVAVGNASIEGVTAFAQSAFAEAATPPLQGLTAQDTIDLLEAFQSNLLPMLGQPGARAMFEQQLRAQWFASEQGGTSWAIVDSETRPGDRRPPPPSADELAAEAAWLAVLNDSQASLDQAQRELRGARRELWELWWKKGAAKHYHDEHGQWPWTIVSETQFDDALAVQAARASALLQQIETLKGQVPRPAAGRSPAKAISDFAGAKGLPPTRTLKAVAEPRFWGAADPVIVVSNTAHTMRIEPDAVLRCRWAPEMVTQLAMSQTAGDGSPAFTVGKAQLAPYLPSMTWTSLPALAADLFAEFFLLDPANAPLLAAAAGHGLSGNDLSALAPCCPLPRAAEDKTMAPAILPPFEWSQPWQPLFLDWEVAWRGVPFLRADGTPNWAFGGLDYDLVSPATEARPVKYIQGRTTLTPKPSFEFKSRLEEFLADYPRSPVADEIRAVGNLVETVDAWDFLSQTLGGLQAHLASWQATPVANPAAIPIAGHGTADQLIGEGAGMPPDPGVYESPAPPPTSTYEGIRAGQLYLNRLAIVDGFGQAVWVVHGPTGEDPMPRTADGGVFHPLAPARLTPTHPVEINEPLRLVQFAPRLLQSARLNFRFVGHSEDNPIAGWIVPNHLDSGLSVYGPDGTAYGELRLGLSATGQGDATRQAVIWVPAPGSPHPVIPEPAQGQDPLDAFLSNLMKAGVLAFRDFLQAIDETLWTVDPLGNRADAFVSVLVGRPLALVTASLAFELQSQAWRDPAWPYTFTTPRPDPLFASEAYRFGVRLGDLGYHQDGLIGYFLDGDYTAFHAIHVPVQGEEPQSADPYLKAIAPGNYVDLSFAARGAGNAASLALLMDPRGSVHAQCGILPVKDISLKPDWVDAALAKLALTFRAGPLLVGAQMQLQTPATHKGTWSWTESDAHGNWIDMKIGAADASAHIPLVPVTLREGLLRLTDGLDT